MDAMDLEMLRLVTDGCPSFLFSHLPCPRCWGFLLSLRAVGFRYKVWGLPALLSGILENHLGCRRCSCRPCLHGQMLTIMTGCPCHTSPSLAFAQALSSCLQACQRPLRACVQKVGS